MFEEQLRVLHDHCKDDIDIGRPLPAQLQLQVLANVIGNGELGLIPDVLVLL